MWWECRSIRAQEEPVLGNDNIKIPATSGRSYVYTNQLRQLINLQEEADCFIDSSTRPSSDELRSNIDSGTIIFTSLAVNQAVQLRCLDNMLMAAKPVKTLDYESNVHKPLKTSTILQKFIVTEERYNTWLKVVEDYSARTFTKITDRFPALSGLASEMQAVYGGEYVAGVWRDDLPRSLLWRRDLKPISSTSIYTLPYRPSEYRGPSWSWVAIDDAISYDLVVLSRQQIDKFRPTTAQIEDVGLVPAGSDPKGRLKGGCMLIRGKLKLYMPSNASRSMVFHFDFRDEAEDNPIYLLSL